MKDSGETTSCLDCDGVVTTTPNNKKVCQKHEVTIAWEKFGRYRMCKQGSGQGYFAKGSEVFCRIEAVTHTGNWCGQTPAE